VGVPPAGGLGMGLTTHHKNQLVMKCYTMSGIAMDSLNDLGDGKWM